MIPIRDHNPSRTTPVITYLLLFINVAVFALMFTLTPESVEEFMFRYALIPSEIVNGQDLYTLLTSMFLHGSIGHIIGNMLFLHIFGDNLEDTLGHIKYLLFYVLSGLVASMLQIVVDPSSNIPNLGASGAIAGLMGGYLILFPSHRIDVLVPFAGFLNRTTVPAFTMLFYWIIFQFFSGFGQLAAPGTGGVAYFAHIGGFVAGVVLVKILGSLNTAPRN